MYNGDNKSVLQSSLVNRNSITTLSSPVVGANSGQPNYALKLNSGESITHNRFVVPDWGNLRFDIHVPEPARLDDKDDYIQVYLETDDQSFILRDKEIDPSTLVEDPSLIPVDEIRAIPAAVDLREVHPQAVAQPLIQSQLNRIGYGSKGFETFQVNVPDEMRGKTARLRFKLHGDTEVYIDNVFFQSEHLKFGNPSLNQQEARTEQASQPNNYLIEKPQYAVSYNDSLKTPNWVSYKLDPSWLGGVSMPRPNFAPDLSLPFADATISEDYSKTGQNGTIAIRGHLVPNQDRERGIESYHTIPNPNTGAQDNYSISKDNYLTYLTTNVVPQPQYDTAWQKLEGDINTFVRKSNNPNNEVYVITGRYGSIDRIQSLLPSELPSKLPSQIKDRTSQFNIDVPEWLWKVVLIPEAPGQSPTDITTKAISFGVLLPNTNQQPSKLDWRKHIFSVNDIEDLTGYNFFSNIATEVQEKIEDNTTLPLLF
ncbi:MAG: DNA/RNA non-specific endonuclease [Oscillatoriales cyanobacterium]|uniref:DNA/RNA non-specific endonuclease n=1 Tax=Microcoleus sp. PH2017_25_DOB_D_A TaxID=2798835 RepID=UPI001D6CEC72|nr:DNA/RNA non-specific endonuclease [Microcoleus sp. PH2017_25_DOB_D_A]MCC3547949.1 DNA/RNA non-specific endonuclease [Microcoleus sp. PH2017_24_DOB_U_A]TAE10951.1 MAG: DNA/RNA non-specific endonuclease [Oscillatoriales cyanobacterium]TAG60914.1 MAG: DNA/RNA non-specific endonuclease [Oscillatoriales cyanobacterium]TAG65707.1 MAG: DNA/RNA non-specific endonuclease [Oscillatoriales cyanobacterium]